MTNDLNEILSRATPVARSKRGKFRLRWFWEREGPFAGSSWGAMRGLYATTPNWPFYRRFFTCIVRYWLLSRWCEIRYRGHSYGGSMGSCGRCGSC